MASSLCLVSKEINTLWRAAYMSVAPELTAEILEILWFVTQFKTKRLLTIFDSATDL